MKISKWQSSFGPGLFWRSESEILRLFLFFLGCLQGCPDDSNIWPFSLLPASSQLRRIGRLYHVCWKAVVSATSWDWTAPAPLKPPLTSFWKIRHNVLPAVATPCAAHPQAAEPSSVVQPLHVHGFLPAQLPTGEETLHHLCLGLPGGPFPHLLQLLG